MGNAGARNQKRTTHVDLLDQVKALDLDIEGCSEVDGGRIVDADIDRTEMIGGAVDRGVDCIGIADVLFLLELIGRRCGCHGAGHGKDAAPGCKGRLKRMVAP